MLDKAQTYHDDHFLSLHIDEDLSALENPDVTMFDVNLSPTPENRDDLLKESVGRRTVLPTFRSSNGKAELVSERRDRYQSVRPLGEGAAGEVVLVTDNDIDRKVAMKRLKPSLHHPSLVARFIDEIRAIGQLEHPNIIPIHDVGIDEDGALYYLMKYVEGETLEEIIDKLAEGDEDYHRRFSFERRVQIFMEVLRAVHFAHSKGIIHRDLKPANIMVGPYGDALVMDWGLARLVNSMDPQEQREDESLTERQRLYQTVHGTLVGTPAYMAPEQAEGRNEEVDARTDLYALNALFYEFLTLEHYLGDQTTLEGMLMAIVNRPAPVAMNVDNGIQGKVPAELSHFVRHGLAKSPEHRYQDAGEMIESLERVIDGTFKIECPVTFTKRANHWVVERLDRRPMLTLPIMMGTLGLVAASMIFSVVTILT